MITRLTPKAMQETKLAYIALLGSVLVCMVALNSEAAVSQWESFKLLNGHIHVPIKVHGIEGSAIVDTGASMMGLADSSLGDIELQRGKTTTVVGAFGSRQAKTFDQVPVNIFGADFTWSRMLEIENAFDFLVIIGSPLFYEFVVQLDYPNRRMRIITRDAVDLKKQANVPFKINSGMPMVKVDLNGQGKTWLLLDTGSGGGIAINRKLANRKGWIDKFPSQPGTAEGANHQIPIRHFVIPTLTIGPHTLADVSGYYPEEGHQIRLIESQGRELSRIKESSMQGILGYDVLKHFVVTLDFKSEKMHLGLPAES